MKMKITPCIGCNACWLKTPGICAVKDDYEQILKACLEHDTAIIISDTSLSFISYKAKNVVDRMLPLATMYVHIVDGQMRHIPRYEKKYRFGIVYSGTADRAYMEQWLERFALNLSGISIGAFPKNKDILFALPLYVENVPGIMLEFLGSLTPKTGPDTRLSFLVQGGFPEACQSRCCENFLKTLPEKLGCEYGGTFIRGDMFGIGRAFAQYGYFDAEIISRFASPEYLSEKEIRRFEKFGKYMQKWFMNRIAKRLGCKEKLDAKPYIEI